MPRHGDQRRLRIAHWLELPALTVTATLLGPIALVAVLNNRESDI